MGETKHDGAARRRGEALRARFAQYLGATSRELKLELFVTETEKREAKETLIRAGLDAEQSAQGDQGS